MAALNQRAGRARRIEPQAEADDISLLFLPSFVERPPAGTTGLLSCLRDIIHSFFGHSMKKLALDRTTCDGNDITPTTHPGATRVFAASPRPAYFLCALEKAAP